MSPARLFVPVVLLLATLAAAPAARRLDARGYRMAVAPYTFVFPRDHASHPGYALEWWYWTGYLAADTRTFGYELTFFRVALAPRTEPSPSAWRTPDALFAHLALTDDGTGRFRDAERAARPALGLAGTDSTREHVWIGEWSAELAETHARTCCEPAPTASRSISP